MKTFGRSLVVTALMAVLFSTLTAPPASARVVQRRHTRSHVAHRYQNMHPHSRVAARRPSARPGIGTHGTASTGAGVTGTNMVPAGGTNADPLGGGTTSAGTATTGSGTSNK